MESAADSGKEQAYHGFAWHLICTTMNAIFIDHAGFPSGFWSRGVKIRYNGFLGGAKYYPLGSKAYGYLGHL